MRERLMSSNASVKPCRVAAQVERESACIRDWIYAEINDRIVRYALPAGSACSAGRSGNDRLRSASGGRSSHASVHHRCQGIDVCRCGHRHQRLPGEKSPTESPGVNPCTELETRGGVWRYDANKTGQKFSPAAALRDGNTQCGRLCLRFQRQTIRDPTRTRPTACELA